MNYEQKYLKYKKKYIELKQKGGRDISGIPFTSDLKITVPVTIKSDFPSYMISTGYSYMISTGYTTNILIVSHNARMRCFIDSLKDVKDNLDGYKSISNIIKFKLGDSKEKEIRFMNGAILKVTLFKGSSTGKISLFYEGEVNNRKPGLYFVSAPTSASSDPSDTIFGVYDFDYTQSFGISPLNFNVNFLIVRHGEGTHNLKDNPQTWNFITGMGTDPTLTFDGEMQAKKAGDFIKEQNPPIKFDVVFVSTLVRTRQTAYLILKNSKNTKNIGPNTKFIVLPCSHELLYYNKEGKSCDELNAMIPRASENISNCVSIRDYFIEKNTSCTTFFMTYFDKNKYRESITKNKKLDQQSKDKMLKEIESQEKLDTGDINIQVVWDDYNEFYKKKQCRDTNMIKEAVEILLNKKDW